jgi:hypothetical protein
MFRVAMEGLQKKGNTKPVYWIEMDVVPLVPGWLDTLEAEYQKCGKAFMGTVYDKPFRHLNGSMVYAANFHKFNPFMMGANEIPFDIVRHELNLRNGHDTPLMQRMLADPNTNTPMTFPTVESLSVLREGAVTFHGVKDGTLIDRLRERRQYAALGIPEPMPAPSLVQKIKQFIKGKSGFVHAGNCGDIIYSLAAIKAHGGGKLILCPQQRGTAVCAVPITKEQFDLFHPLLSAQPYLTEVTYQDKHPGDAIHDLNRFRNLWVNTNYRKKMSVDTLCKCHFLELGIVDKFLDSETWLSVENPIETGRFIVHRSPRYNAPSSGPEAFPWPQLVKTHASQMMFVGLEHEYEKFQRDWNTKLSFWKVRDFLEMARLIAGAKGCIMNQSFPLSIAIGLGQKVMVEACPRSADTRFKRDNYIDQLLQPKQISMDWFDEPSASVPVTSIHWPEVASV